jgi:hypothetical protein
MKHMQLEVEFSEAPTMFQNPYILSTLKEIEKILVVGFYEHPWRNYFNSQVTNEIFTPQKCAGSYSHMPLLNLPLTIWHQEERSVLHLVLVFGLRCSLCCFPICDL